MNKAFAIIAGLVLLTILVLFSATYTVSFNEVAIKTRFGKTSASSVITEPGLKFKLPVFAERVTTLDTRLQILQTPLETVPTADGQQIVLEGFMMWRVDVEDPEGPLQFFRNFASTEDANRSMRDQFLTATRQEVGRYSFNELVGSNNTLQQAEQAVLDSMRAFAADGKGIQPMTVGFSRMQLPPKTARAVLERMRATRQRLSEAERSKGDSEAQRIEAEATIKADKIRAFARQRAEEIRAQGDIEAARYLEDMSVDEDFAILLVWLKTLEISLSENATMILPGDEPPWHLMRLGEGLDDRGIPQPAQSVDPLQGDDNDEAASESVEQNEKMNS